MQYMFAELNELYILDVLLTAIEYVLRLSISSIRWVWRRTNDANPIRMHRLNNACVNSIGIDSGRLEHAPHVPYPGLTLYELPETATSNKFYGKYGQTDLRGGKKLSKWDANKTGAGV